MNTFHYVLNYILHIDVYLTAFVAHYGFWTYLVLFAVIFCETGLIITPFLPGDSLLFAAGSIAAQPASSLSITLLFLLLLIASISGNQVNFWVGKTIGTRIFKFKNSRLLNPHYLHETHRFYEKHGGKTLIFARFMPIIRTFAPFIAGIGNMRSFAFFLYNIVSALLWIGSLLFLGYFLGSLPVVKDHFTVMIYGIIVLSLMPPVLAFFSKKITTCSRCAKKPNSGHK